MKRNVDFERLKFTTDLTELLDDVEVVFSAMGTPPDEDDSTDLKYVLAVVRQFGQTSIIHHTRNKVNCPCRHGQ